MADTVPLPQPRPDPSLKKSPAPPPGFKPIATRPKVVAAPPPPPGFTPVGKKPAPSEEGSFLPELGKAIAGGAVDTAGTVLKGASGQNAAILQGRIDNAKTRIKIMDLIDAGKPVPPEFADDLLGTQGEVYLNASPDERKGLRQSQQRVIDTAVQPGDVTEHPLYKAGQATQEWSAKQFKAAKDYEDSWTRMLGQGLGSTLPFLATGPEGVLATGSAASTGSQIEDAVRKGATREQIMQAIKLGGVPGLSENLPLEVIFERVPLPAMGKVMGAVTKVLASALAEGGQEGLQQAAQNLVAQYVYDPDQDVMEGVLQSAGVGAFVGGTVSGGVQVGESVVDKVTQGGSQRAEQPLPGRSVPSSSAPAEPPTPPSGFTPAGPPRDEGAPAAAPEGQAVNAPPDASPPVAPQGIDPADVSILRQMKWADDDILNMSPDEVRQEADRGRAAGLQPAGGAAPPLQPAETGSEAPPAAPSTATETADSAPLSPEIENALAAAAQQDVAGATPPADVEAILTRRTRAAHAVNRAIKGNARERNPRRWATVRREFVNVMRELEQADPAQFQHFANLPGNKVQFPELQQPAVPQPSGVDAAPVDVRPRGRGGRRGPLDIVEFLASEGGIRDFKGELGSLDLGKRFVPGFGRLLRESGNPLDRARELAAEEGYFNDQYGDADTAMARSTVADLLRLIDRNERGNRVFTTEGGRRREEIDAQRQPDGSTTNQARDESALAELVDLGLREGDPFTDRVLMIMRSQEIDPVDAIEQAAMQETAAAGASELVNETPMPFFGDENAAQPGAPSPSGEEVGAGSEQNEGSVPQGDIEGFGPPAPGSGEGSSSVSAEANPQGAVESVGERGVPPVADEFDTAFDQSLDESFPPAPPPGFTRVADDRKPILAKLTGLLDHRSQTAAREHGVTVIRNKDASVASRMFQYPLTYRDEKLLLAHPALANDPFVRDVQAKTGVEATFDPDAETPAFSFEHRQWHHAVDLANDEHVQQLIDTLEFTTPKDAMRAAAYGFEHKQLSYDNLARLMNAVDAQRPPDADLDDMVKRIEISSTKQGKAPRRPKDIAPAEWPWVLARGYEKKLLQFRGGFLMISSRGEEFLGRQTSASEPGAEGRPQTLLPGVAPVTDKDRAAVAAAKPLTAKRPQKEPGGLFGDDKDQTDINDLLKTEKKPTEDLRGKIGEKQGRWTRIGWNSIGNPVWEDDQGVRSHTQAGIRITEKVGFHPTGRIIKPTSHDAEFMPVGTAGESAKSAAANVAMGLDQVMRGLEELFGGKGAKLSAGFTFDEETYRKAVPFFKAGIEHFAEAGRDVAEMVRRLVRHLAQSGMSREAIENMRPYVRRFVEDETKTSSKPDGKINMPAVEAAKPGELSIVETLRDRLVDPDGGFASIVDARKFLRDNGWNPKSETIANKEAEELIEHAVVLAAREIVQESKKRGAEVTFDRLVALYGRQPRLNSRTSQSMAEQAYSTPIPLAYVASRLAGITSNTSVLEPTAGNGALLIEASPAKAQVNEINSERAANLMQQGFRVSTRDATESGLRHAGYPVDVVIANPPFGAVRSGGDSKVFTVGEHKTTAVDHAIALNALQHMKDDGRAVLIVGGIKADSDSARADGYGGQQKRKFYWRLYNNYRVVQHFTVSGDLYQRQGAAWPVDVIVIDGKGKSSLPLPAASVPPIVHNWEGLKGYIDERSGEVSRPGGGEVPGSPEIIAEPAVGDRPSDKADGQREPAGEQTAPDRQPKAGSVPVDQPKPEPSTEQFVEGDPGGGHMAGGGEPAGTGISHPARSRGQRVTDTNATGQVPYRPYSEKGTKLNTLVPGALGASMDRALADIERRHGDIDQYVARELGYSLDELPDVFSAEQIDALAMAIDNVAKGDAFIIGDQTGIGKGRVVAGAIRFAHKKGLVPVFVTEKPDLYGDMFRDLTDIGWAKALGREPRIFMTNANTSVPLNDEAVDWISDRDEARAAGQPEPPQRGRFSERQSTQIAEKRMSDILDGSFKPDVVFTSYDQMNSVQGKETNRRRFLTQIASRAFIIMDESHNAGGQGDVKNQQRVDKKAPPPRSQMFRRWVGQARAVMYSSATYAKNPNVMDLYSRTDMSKAVNSPEELPALIQKGGVPLQQVVASMLADAGQYARRERSFEGVEYGLETAPVDQESYADFAKAIKLIYRFDREIGEFRDEWIKEWLAENGAGKGKDSGIGDIAANSTEFAAIMHNVVNQMLLSIKAETAAQRALQAIADGEKPVIALSKTAESFISDFAEDNGIDIGDAIDINFKDVVKRYLARTLRITVKMPDDTKKHVWIPVQELGSYEDAYRQAEAAVERLNLSSMPVSPIDHIRNRITAAGHSIREVTGRQSMLDYAARPTTFVVRPKEEQNASGKRVTIKKFNDGALDAVILNKSGATGVSLHASSKFKDRRRRRMILVEADPNIDTHMQMLGRVHRTGQVIPPAYTQLAADIPAEARPAAVLMKKMASLNANTTAARKSAFTADVVDFMNEYGDQAAILWARDHPMTNFEMGSPVQFDTKGLPKTENPIQKLTGRIMLLDPVEQQDLIDTLTASYNAILAQKDAMGENALEAKALDLQAEPVKKVQLRPSTGRSPFEGEANLETMRVKSAGRSMKASDVLQRVARELDMPAPTTGFVRGMQDLQRAGGTHADQQYSRVRQEYEAWKKTVVDGVKNAASRETAQKKAAEQWKQWSGINAFAQPGAMVSLASAESEQTTPAIVLSVDQRQSERGKTLPNPVAPSSWTVTFALPDASRQITIPFSQISLGNSGDEMAAGVVMRQPPFTDNLAAIEKMFDTASKEGKEERLIATGNLLAAYDQLQGRGQIIQFTDVSGNVRPGVLMSRTYSVEQFEKERRVKFAKADQVMAFLERAKDKTVTDINDVITISDLYGQGREYTFSVEAPRTKGGRYVTDDTVRRIYDQWVNTNGYLIAKVDKATAHLLIAALRNMGVTFVAGSEHDLANAIVHPTKAKPVQSSAAAPQPQRMSDADVAKAREIVRRVAGVDPHIIESYSIDTDPAWGITSPQYGSGFYNFIKDVVAIARLGGDHVTAYHEAFHRLQNFFLTDRELRILNAMTEQLRETVRIFRGDIADRMDASEIQTEAFALWSVAMDAQSPIEMRLHIAIRRAWEHLRQLIRRVKEVFGADPTLRDIFAPARLGITARRTPLAEGRTPQAYRQTPRQSSTPTARVPLVPAGTPPRSVPGILTTQRISAALTRSVGGLKSISPKDRRHAGDGETIKDYVTRKFEDYLHPLRMMQEEHGHNLNELNDAYMNARLMEDAAMADVQTMHSKYVDPAVDALADVGATIEDLHRFMYAMHAQERNEVIGRRHPFDSDLYKAIDDTSVVGASGMSTDQANKIVEDFRRQPEKHRGLVIAARHIRRMLDDQLRSMRSAGLISDETLHALTTQWRNYVPLKGMEGVDEDGFYKPGLSGFDVRGQEYKTALGRFSEAENVLAHAIVQSEHGILRQHKNDVGKAVLRFINEFDPTGENVAEVFWAGKDSLGDIQKADQVYRRTLGEDGKVRYVRVPNPFSNRDDVLAAKVGGKTYWIKFHDPKVGLALRKLSKWELGTALKIVRWATVMQSIVNTRANPAFTPINVIRDIQTGAVHLLDEGFSAKQVAGVMRNIPKAWAALWRMSRGTAGADQWDTYAKEYVDAGGRINFDGYSTLESTLKNLEKAVSRKVEGENWLMSIARKVWTVVRQINDAGENGIRLAAYVAARKEQGRTAKEAAFMARDLTVDFKKHGETGPTMNALYVFFNASLQGSMNIVRRIHRSRKVRAAVAAAMFAGMMQHMWNMLFAGDDDDGENYYQKMLKNEPWKFERQFVFFIPGTGRYVSFPMPYGYNAFHNFGMNGGAIMTGDKTPMAAIADTLRVYFDAFNPIGSGSLASMLSPTVTDPVVDLYINENAFGSPIYPSENPFDRSPPPHSTQAFSNTHPWFRAIAEAMNWTSGGDEIVPGAVDVYPDALEHLWGYAVGGLGRFITQAEQSVEGMLRGEIEPAKVPWVRSFYGEVDDQSQKTQYYRMREEVLAAEGYQKSYAEAGDDDRRQAHADRHSAELSAAPAFKAAEKERKRINRERRRIAADRDITAAERDSQLENLDKAELELMREARKAYIEAAKQASSAGQ